MPNLSLLQGVLAVLSGSLVAFALGLVGGGGSLVTVPGLAAASATAGSRSR